jgi:hypothetical protein
VSKEEVKESFRRKKEQEKGVLKLKGVYLARKIWGFKS